MLRHLVRPAVGRSRLQVAGIHLARDGLALLPDAAVVIDAQVPADADDPRLKIRPPIERAQRLEYLQEDILRQVLGFIVLADELVGDVEDLPPVLSDDGFPRRLVTLQT